MNKYSELFGLRRIKGKRKARVKVRKRNLTVSLFYII